MKTNRNHLIIMAIASVMILFACMMTACGDSDSNESKGFISGSDLYAAFTDINAYKGYDTAFYGKAFSIEYDGSDTYIQVWQDYENYNNNVIVIYSGKPDIKEDDYVYVEGRILGEYEGENLLGGKVIAMQLKATTIRKASYIEAVVPTRLSVDINKTVTQKNYSISVEKVEFADTETRIYVKAANNGKSTFNIHTYSAKVKQGKKQYEQESNYFADYKSLSGELLQDTEDDGIFVFPALSHEDFTLIIGGYSDDWNEDIKDFTFKIEIPGEN